MPAFASEMPALALVTAVNMSFSLAAAPLTV
jgi:hypothetical protein